MILDLRAEKLTPEEESEVDLTALSRARQEEEVRKWWFEAETDIWFHTSQDGRDT